MTTKFLDGPAAGQQLELSRAPLFLRVVIDAHGNGKLDALDQLADMPLPSEAVYAYRMVSIDRARAAVNIRGRSASW